MAFVWSHFRAGLGARAYPRLLQNATRGLAGDSAAAERAVAEAVEEPSETAASVPTPASEAPETAVEPRPVPTTQDIGLDEPSEAQFSAFVAATPRVIVPNPKPQWAGAPPARPAPPPGRPSPPPGRPPMSEPRAPWRSDRPPWRNDRPPWEESPRQAWKRDQASWKDERPPWKEDREDRPPWKNERPPWKEERAPWKEERPPWKEEPRWQPAQGQQRPLWEKPRPTAANAPRPQTAAPEPKAAPVKQTPTPEPLQKVFTEELVVNLSSRLVVTHVHSGERSDGTFQLSVPDRDGGRRCMAMSAGEWSALRQWFLSQAAPNRA